MLSFWVGPNDFMAEFLQVLKYRGRHCCQCLLHWTLVHGAEGTDCSKLISVMFMSDDQIFLYRIPADRIKARDSTHPPRPKKTLNFCIPPLICTIVLATVNQHPPVHHPLDAHYFSVVDESQLS
jgi:hypothetical protein